ncbi:MULTISPECIES: ParB N-terminal domain-containing protein [Sulfolobaceae]|uniref:ParB N-terminal domain-containing protein n=1 Tax=Sulfolobaceae TaxID=118883 RepID=UPI0031733CA8
MATLELLDKLKEINVVPNVVNASVPLSYIFEHPRFSSLFTRSEEEIGRMKESIKNESLLQPLIVTEDKGSKNRFLLIDGYVRYYALRELHEGNWDKVLVQVRIIYGSLEQLEMVAYAVNFVRKAVDKSQLLDYYSRLQELRERTGATYLDTLELLEESNVDLSVRTFDLIIKHFKKYPVLFKKLGEYLKYHNLYPTNVSAIARAIPISVREKLTKEDVDLILQNGPSFFAKYKLLLSQIRDKDEYMKTVKDLMEDRLREKIKKFKKRTRLINIAKIDDYITSIEERAKNGGVVVLPKPLYDAFIEVFEKELPKKALKNIRVYGEVK